MRFTPANQLWKSHHGLYGRFLSNPQSKTSFYNLGQELNCTPPFIYTRLCDAMYRVQENKSKFKLFYRLFTMYELFCHIFLALGLNTCLNSVWNYCYTYQSDLMPFKCCGGFCFFLGLLTSFLHASILTSGRQW